MPERCDCCGMYLKDDGLLCEKCRRDMKFRIKHRSLINEERVEELEVAYESVRN